MSESDKTQPGDSAAPPPGARRPGSDTEPRLRRPATGPLPGPPSITVGGDVGGDVAGRDVHKPTTAGRDVVGGDVVTNTTTHVGFSASAVQRLLITVGVLVFVTAFCFFSSGFVLGGAALVALNRDVASSQAAADRFAAGLAALQSLQPGETATFQFTEDEISSYFRFVLAPTMGGLNVSDGRVRLLENGRLVVGGQAQGLGGVNFAATFEVTDAIGRPLNLQAAAVQALPTRDTAFGWVLVPNLALGGVERSLNDLFGNVQVLQLAASGDGQTWAVLVRAH
jgi:hypothetical protein